MADADQDDLYRPRPARRRSRSSGVGHLPHSDRDAGPFGFQEANADRDQPSPELAANIEEVPRPKPRTIGLGEADPEKARQWAMRNAAELARIMGTPQSRNYVADAAAAMAGSSEAFHSSGLNPYGRPPRLSKESWQDYYARRVIG